MVGIRSRPMHEDRRCISKGLLYPLISFVIVFAFASICVVLIFHPNERHDIDTITQSRIFQDTVLVAAVIGLPMGADVFLDCFAFSRSTVPERIHLVTRILLLLSLTLPSFYLYVAVLLDNLSAASYASVLALTNVTSRGCVCIFLSLHDKKIGSGPICISISFCYAITESMRLLLFLHNHDLEAFEHTLLTFMTFIWLQLLYLFFKWWTTEKSSEDFFIVAYLLCLSAMTLEYVLMLFGLENIGEITLNPFKVSASMYSQIAFIVICMTVSGRASRSSLQKCADTMEERQAFVRYISHELRTPMNAVFLGITFIKDEIRSIPPALTEYIGHIYETVDDVNNCCEVAISILNDLLTFDKLEEGKMTVEFEETPIKDYVTDAVKPFRVEARQKNIEILVNINGDESGWEILAAIQVDRHKMSQVIRNLLSNAIKFTPPDGKVTVNMTRVNRQNPYSSFTPKTINILRFLKGKTCSVSPHTQDSRHFAAEDSIDYLRIEVIDTGAGISPENQKKLFGQYVQFDAGKLQKGSGSGLGLWISKGIVSLHGGFIGAFSAGVGEGSIFYVELPLYVRGFCHAGNIRHPPRPVLRRGNSSSSKRDFASEILFHSSRKSDATRSFVEDAHMIFEMTNRMSSRSFNRQDDGKSSSCRDECIHNIRETEYECGEVTRAASSAVLSLKVETGRSQDKTDLKKRILVVDDSAATRKIMSRVLSNKGYHVDTAYDGVDCLRIVQENITKCEVAYSIIIMDDNMPNLSGPDACKILRTNGYIGMLCGVTGNVSDADILNFKNQGATVVLPKPLDMNVLESLFSEFGI